MKGTVYMSRSRDAGWSRRLDVIGRLRHAGLDQVRAQLARPAGNPPLYLAVARDLARRGGEKRG
jgi:serine/threonine protein kinase HipA of HipAB toxin-antitoxin module